MIYSHPLKPRPRNRKLVVESLEERLAPANLQSLELVPAISSPAAGSSFTVSWTINNSEGQALAGNWFDRLSLSTDAIPDVSDLPLGGRFQAFPNDGSLAAGSSYTASAMVAIPTSISGPRYLILEADALDEVSETNTADNFRTAILTVGPAGPGSSRPDLRVSGVTIEPPLIVGQPSVIRYTVTNDGPGLAPESGWSESLYLSPTAEFQQYSTVLATSYNAPVGGLSSGASVERSFTTTLPLPTNGGPYPGSVFVVADTSGQLYEANETNNRSGTLVNLAATRDIDLRPTAFTAPGTLIAGERFNVTYSVTNQGQDMQAVGYAELVVKWEQNGQAQVSSLGTVSTIPILLNGQSYSGSGLMTMAANLPTGFSYQLELRVQANYQNYESNTANNTLSSPLALVLPDIRLRSMNLPSPIATGKTTVLEYQLENLGPAPILTPWSYSGTLWVATDAAGTNRVYMESVYTSRNSPLPVGSLLTAVQDISLPSHLEPGLYYFGLTIDPDQFRSDVNRTNQQLVIQAQVIEGNENPNPQPSLDLALSELNVPASLLHGQSASIPFTVSVVAGTFPAFQSEIVRLYHSSDAVLDTSDKLLTESSVYNYSGENGSSNTKFSSTFNLDPTVSLSLPLGNSYFIAVINSTSGDGEDTNTANNQLATAVTIEEPTALNTPDLAIQAIETPVPLRGGLSTTLEYQAKNVGAVSQTGYWSDYVYLSKDATLNAEDVLVGSSYPSFGTQVLPGESYRAKASINLPSNVSEFAKLIVSAGAYSGSFDLNPANNTLAVPLSLNEAAPDITISASLTGTPAIGSQLGYSFTVTNTSSISATGDWYDVLVWSNDTIIDKSDVLISSTVRASNLTPGGSYTVEGNIPISSSTPQGKYLLFGTDAMSYNTSSNSALLGPPAMLLESNELNNTFNAGVVNFPMPDLEISATSVPTSLVFGVSTPLGWTIKNTGHANSPAGFYYYGVYLSEDATLDTSKDVVVLNGSLYRSEPLPAGGTLSFNPNVSWPSVDFTSGYLIFVADHYGIFNEFSETNNAKAVAVSITGPDLVVSSAKADDTTLVPGQNVSLQFTVKNQGNEAALADWFDGVYFSKDADFSSDDLDLGAYSAAAKSPLDRDESYTADIVVTIPSRIDADAGFLIVKADRGFFAWQNSSAQSELNEANNAFAIPVTVTRPDLIISQLTMPNTVTTGQSVTINFTTRNRGSVSVLPNNTSWQVSFYLSADANFQPLADIYLGQVTQSGTIAADGLLTGSFTTVLQDYAQGPYRIFALVDSNSNVGETDEANNFNSASFTLGGPDLVITNLVIPDVVVPGETVDISYIVRNAGEQSTAANWANELRPSDYSTTNWGLDIQADPLGAGQSRTMTRSLLMPSYLEATNLFLTVNNYNTSGQRIGETDFSNNTLSRPISLSRPNLKIEDVVLPSAISAGKTYDVSWKVTNTGSVPAYGDWIDGVYLSDSAGIYYYYFNTKLLELNKPDGALAPGASYIRNGQITIPANTAGGEYFLHVITDPSRRQAETNDLPAYYFTQADSDNIVTQAVNLGSADLQIELLSVPETITPGIAFDVTYQVTNKGVSTATVDWQDVIYYGNTASEIVPYWYGNGYVTTVPIAAQTPLEPGASYTITKTITLPAGLSGERYLIIATDGYNQQGETVENNNRTSKLYNLGSPDLTITSGSAPSTLTLGQEAKFSWTVQNIGSDPAYGDWTDRLYFSADEVLDSTDQLFYSETIAGQTPLAAGASYTVTRTVTIPQSGATAKYVIFVADQANVQGETNETNNLLAVAISAESPDLIVESIEAPITAKSGEPTLIHWTVKNIGEVAASGNWVERVYASRDRFGINKTQLGQFNLTGPIEVDSSVTRAQQIDVPYELIGSQYWFIEVDSGNNLPESNNSNNTAVTSKKTLFGLSDYPNLQVSAVQVPEEGFSSRDIVVNWTVTNVGLTDTNAPFWSDRLWLSVDTILDRSDISLGIASNSEYLQSQGSYNNSLTVRLPNAIQGEFHVLVETDIFGQVFERGLDNDNTAASSSFTVNLTPPPDLQVAKVLAPANAFSGQPTTISWTVSNFGNGPTVGTNWYDEVYLSEDETLDSGDRSLGAFLHTGKLLATESYTASQVVTPPLDKSGTFYVLVRTDRFNSENEYAFENNNTNVATPPTVIRLTPPPDLEIENLKALPGTVVAGQTLYIEGDLINAGSSAPQVGTWTNTFYLSKSTTFDAKSTILVGSRLAVVNSTLNAGASTSLNTSFLIPAIFEPGSYYLFAIADSTDVVFELNNDNNTARTALPIIIESRPADLLVSNVTPEGTGQAGQIFNLAYTVTNQGTGDTVATSWSDNIIARNGSGDTSLGSITRFGLLAPGQSRLEFATLLLPFTLNGAYQLIVQTDSSNGVYESNEANNTASAAWQVTRNVSDLVVDSVTGPSGETPAGTELVVSWTVRNAGTAPTGASFWYDRVVLSSNGLADTVELGEVRRTNPLNGGASYSATGRFQVPATLAPGTYFVKIITDWRNQADEPFGEANNSRLTASAINIGEALPDTKDLAITNVQAPATAISGQLVTIEFTVTNTGETVLDSPWYDAVYLSFDDSLERGSDVYLGFADRPNALNPGQSYTTTFTARIPNGVAGSLNVLVITDAGNRIHPEQDDENNLGLGSVPISVSLLPPADLVAGEILVPANATAGMLATITYTVTNAGSNPALGSWSDALYLSSDDAFDLGDVLFGRVIHSGDVPGGNSYTESLTAPLPGLVAGQYKLIVRSDIRNQVREANESNNTTASLESFAVDVPTLSLGVPALGTLDQGQSVFYRVDVDAGQTLLVTLDGLSDTALTELFIRHSTAATRTLYDARSLDPISTDQHVVINFTEAGTYYILAYGGPGTHGLSYSLTASVIEFSVFDSSYGLGGTAGNRSIEVNGAQFDESVTAHLINQTGTEVAEAVQYYRVDENRLFATFNLRTVAPGTYDVAFRNGTGDEVVVQDGLQVVPGGGARVSVTRNTPTALRRLFIDPPSVFEFSIAWANSGLNDAPAPLIEIGSTAPFAELPDLIPNTGVASSSNATRYSGIELNLYTAGLLNDGPPGILLPQQSGLKRFYALRDATPDTIQIWTENAAEREWSFDWIQDTNLRQYTAREGDALTLLSEQLAIRHGGTWADFVAALSTAANAVPPQENMYDAAMSYLVLQVEQQISASLAGMIINSGISHFTTAYDVQLTNADTGDAVDVVLQPSGQFLITSLPLGDYTLRVINTSGSVVHTQEVSITTQTLTTLSPIVLGETTSVEVVVTTRTGEHAHAAIVYAIVNDAIVAVGTTDDEGHVVLDGVPLGTAQILAYGRDTTARTHQTITVTADESQVALQLQANFRTTGRVNLEGAGLLQGTAVILAREGDPFNVYIIDTGADGIFNIDMVAAGNYILYISRNGYVDYSTNISIPTGQSVVDLGTYNLNVELVGVEASAAQFLPIALNVLLYSSLAIAAFQVWLGEKSKELLFVTIEEGQEAAATQDLLNLFPAWSGPVIRGYLQYVGILPVGLARPSVEYLSVVEQFLSGSGGTRTFSDGSGIVEQDPPPAFVVAEGEGQTTGGFRHTRTAKQRFQEAYLEALDLAIKKFQEDNENNNEATCEKINRDGEIVYSFAELFDKPELRKLIWVMDRDPTAATGGTGMWGFPGTIAGGVGKGDSREIIGEVVAKISGNTVEFKVRKMKMKIHDTFDFIPGNLTSDYVIRSATVPMAYLEAAGIAKDVNLVIEFEDKERRAAKHITLPDNLKDCCENGCNDPPPCGADNVNCIPAVIARDPNDILGPAGYGDEKWVSVREVLPYTIRFENDPVFATAPAQVVTITQTLDSDLDARTFRLGSFQFGGQVFVVPDNRAFFTERLDLRETRGIYLDVTAGIDIATSEAFWEFRSIDPATGDVPTNPLLGFLPPNLENGEGEGSVSYTIKALKTAETGARIDSQARIVFDVNEPIDTPPIFNTIDATPPTIEVTATPLGEPAPLSPLGLQAAEIIALGADSLFDRNTAILVQWSALDDGTGVGVDTYDVYVSINNGDPELWINDTTATQGIYYGQPGFSYRFTVVPSDFTGNAPDSPPSTEPVSLIGEVDTAKPTSFVNTLPATSTPRFLVNWQGTDVGSGVSRYTIFVSTDGGAYLPWLVNTSETSSYFNGIDGRTYSFFSLAEDLTGNREPNKTNSEASTQALISPPDTTDPETASISGSVFEDLNADGTRDIGEPGLGGWTLFLDANGNNQLDEGERTASTNTNGEYIFANLPAGGYTVHVVLPGDWYSANSGGPNSSDIGLTPNSRDVTTPQQLIRFDEVRADARYDEIDGSGTSIVFIDSGLNLSSSVFREDVIAYQYDYINSDNVADDTSGHGTAVAGIAAQMAPGAKLIPLKVLDGSGRGDFVKIEQALQWVVAHAGEFNIVSVNLSFGDGSGHQNGVSTLSDELAELTMMGVTVFAAAGNQQAARPNTVAYPAADDHVQAVGAVWSQTGGPRVWQNGAVDYSAAPDRIASFSQRDSAGNTLFAPGVNIPTVDRNGKAYQLSGTSAATPHVSALAALAQQLALQELGRRLSASELRTLLHSRGTTILDGDDEADNVQNSFATFKRIDAASLFEAVRNFGDSSVDAVSPTEVLSPAVNPTAALAASVQQVRVSPAEQLTGIEFGFYRAATLDVMIFSDASNNGIQDDGELLRQDVVVFIDVNNNEILDEGEPAQTTNSEGRVSFSGLVPGTFKVGVVLAEGESRSTTQSSAILSSGQTQLNKVGIVPAPIPGDTTPPQVLQTQIQNGETQRHRVNRFSWTFSETVVINNFLQAFRLTNLTTGQSVSLSTSQFQYDDATHTLTWSLDSFAGTLQSLADGYYQWVIDGSIILDSAGNAMSNTTMNFHRLTGDVLGQAVVSEAAVQAVNAILGSRIGMSNWNAEMDLDGDGIITARDRLLMARARGNRLGE